MPKPKLDLTHILMLAEALPAPQLLTLPLAVLNRSARNPRAAEADDELAGLAANLGEPGRKMLAQPPLVEEYQPGVYRIIAGERRLQAAGLAQWESLPCLVYPPLDPVAAHLLRLSENMQRRPMHRLDEALALRVAWLMANADALELGLEAREMARADRPLSELQRELEARLAAASWTPKAPAVTWAQLLDRLGLVMSSDRRDRLIRLLRIDPALHARLRKLPLSDATLRALGTLEPEQQAAILAAVEEAPELAGKIRRMARVIKKDHYTVEMALTEARRQTSTDHPTRPVYGFGADGGAELGAEEDSGGEPGGPAKPARPAEPQAADESAIASAVFALTDAAEMIDRAMATLRGLTLPAGWAQAKNEALQLIQQAI